MGEISRADVAKATAKPEGDKGGAAKSDEQQQPPVQPPVEQPQGGGDEVVQGGAQPPASGQGGASGDEFVYPDDPSIPEQFRGKKASEAAGLFNTLFNTSRQMAQYLQSQGAQGGQGGQATQDPPKPIFDKDDFITGEPDKIEEKLGQLFERRAAPLISDIYKNLTFQTMSTARQTLPHFQKYEQEIVQELAQYPINYTANYAVWKDAHDRVVARHINEITAERGRTKPPLPVTERGNGNQPLAGGSADDLTPDQRRIADGLGIDHGTFARFAHLYASQDGTV